MSEAIRSGGALVSGGISDRGSREAQHHAIRSRQEQGRVLRGSHRSARKQLRAGYKDTDELYQPLYQTGIDALNNVATNAGSFQFDPSQIEDSPAYQFRMQQGLDAINRSYAARGGLGSGNRLIGITDYAQGLASTEYDNEYDRQYGAFSDTLNRYMGIAGMGMHAADARANNINNYRGGMADLISNYGRARAGIYGEAGDIQAGTAIGRANNWASTNMYMADQAGQGWDNYMGGSSKKSGGGGGVA